MEAVVAGQVDPGPVVDDPTRCRLADDHRPHPVAENLARHAAQGPERRGVAAEHRRQVLVDDEPGPDQPAAAQHQREQPDDPRRRRLAGEDHLEAREVDLRLLAGGVSKRSSKRGSAAGRASRR